MDYDLCCEDVYGYVYYFVECVCVEVVWVVYFGEFGV